jgi:hypothetical protein
MNAHLERALIEIYYASAEFTSQQAASNWTMRPEDTELMVAALRTARIALNSALVVSKKRPRPEELAASA